jgi:hypothetical protein
MYQLEQNTVQTYHSSYIQQLNTGEPGWLQFLDYAGKFEIFCSVVN